MTAVHPSRGPRDHTCSGRYCLTCYERAQTMTATRQRKLVHVGRSQFRACDHEGCSRYKGVRIGPEDVAYCPEPGHEPTIDVVDSMRRVRAFLDARERASGIDPNMLGAQDDHELNALDLRNLLGYLGSEDTVAP
jgi:hypothetical protein